MAIETNFDAEKAESAIKQKLGQAGRALKKIDLRGTIEKYPFAAIGIAAAAGAIVGVVRPAPQRGRVTNALISTIGILGFRLVKEAAARELGQYAKNYILNRRDGADVATQGFAGESVEGGGGVRYTPAL